jgi:signal transduction histidine kinase
MTREDGTIELSLRQEQDDAVIDVSDHGPGIPPAMLESIFERFAHVDDGNSAASGFGLGLSIVRAIAETHGGTVSARNRVGGGAVFELRLASAKQPLPDDALAVAQIVSR